MSDRLQRDIDTVAGAIILPGKTLLLPFDQPQYAGALRYLGKPVVVGGRGLVLREIPGSQWFDAFGPVPYGSLPAAPEAFLLALADTGAVSWTCVIRPGTTASILFSPIAIKEHFVHRRDGPPLEPSARTRRHLRRAVDTWTIEERSTEDSIDAATRLYGFLERRTSISPFHRVDRNYFEALATIDGFRCAVATAKGRDSAFLLFAEAGDEIHFCLTAGNDEALRNDGMYAIFNYMTQRYSATHDLYLGGTPAGKNSEGVGRFKARFANMRVPVQLARVILDVERCDLLIKRLGAHCWFPPYRDPFLDEGRSEKEGTR